MYYLDWRIAATAKWRRLYKVSKSKAKAKALLAKLNSKFPDEFRLSRRKTVSRSSRKRPFAGITLSESEKKDKAFAHRKFRRAVGVALSKEVDPLPDESQFGSSYSFSKDGKRQFDPAKHPELVRK